MKITAWIAAVLFLSGCVVGSVTPAENPDPGTNTAPVDYSSNQLVVQSMNPVSNSVIGSNDTLNVTLGYTVASNETTALDFVVNMLFETPSGYCMFISKYTAGSRHGSVTFSEPLNFLWSAVTHPLTVHFTLNNNNTSNSGTELVRISNFNFSE